MISIFRWNETLINRRLFPTINAIGSDRSCSWNDMSGSETIMFPLWYSCLNTNLEKNWWYLSLFLMDSCLDLFFSLNDTIGAFRCPSKSFECRLSLRPSCSLWIICMRALPLVRLVTCYSNVALPCKSFGGSDHRCSNCRSCNRQLCNSSCVSISQLRSLAGL